METPVPRDNAGQFYLTPNTQAVPGEVAYSAHVNQRFADLAYDANLARPITSGGTGATTAAMARKNLGAQGAGDNVVFYDATGARIAVVYMDDAAGALRFTIDAKGTNPAVVMALLRDGSLKLNGKSVLTAGATLPVPAYGDVGSTLLCQSSVAVAPGITVFSDRLAPSGFDANGQILPAVSGNALPAGQVWRAHGRCSAGGVTMFQRIS